jgi:hypothetical protein
VLDLPAPELRSRGAVILLGVVFGSPLLMAIPRPFRRALAPTRLQPDRHLGGALYLFLRGMCGPETPLVDGTPCGVLLATARRAHRGPVRPAQWRSVVTVVEDTYDARSATQARGLATLNAAGVLSRRRPGCGDPRPALRRVQRRSTTRRSSCCAGVARGIGCLDLADATISWRHRRTGRPHHSPGRSRRNGSSHTKQARSCLSGRTARTTRPLRLVDGLLYLDRYWREQTARGHRARRPNVASQRRSMHFGFALSAISAQASTGQQCSPGLTRRRGRGQRPGCACRAAVGRAARPVPQLASTRRQPAAD